MESAGNHRSQEHELQRPRSSSILVRRSESITSSISISKRNVSFSDLVSIGDTHAPSEYKREGYVTKERRRYWFFENERHDEDASFFYCVDSDLVAEVEESSSDGEDMLSETENNALSRPADRDRRAGSQNINRPGSNTRNAANGGADDMDPVLRQLMLSLGGHY